MMSSVHQEVPLPSAGPYMQQLTFKPQYAHEAAPGTLSPAASTLSSGTAGSAGSAFASTTGEVTCHTSSHLGVASMMAGRAAAPAAVANTSSRAGHAAGVNCCPGREWLYRLVTFPSYFTPCHSCCSSSRTPRREQLMTLFDTEYPYKVYCSHCPECKVRNAAMLLQVRRSAFKDVVKATDILRFGADVAGVQQYTLNGSKVIYLNREQTPEKKGSGASTAPAQCSVDGRAMMDKSSIYCSLKCKMHAEDPGFNSWLDTQDPSVRILAQAAANAPPRPTVACKRAAQSTPTSSSGSDDSNSCPKKARTSSAGTVGAAAGAPAAQGSGGESAAPASASAFATMQRAASVPAAGARAASVSAAPTLKRIKISLGSRQRSAPSAFFLETAMKDPALGPSTATGSQGAAAVCASTAELNWESEISSPSFAGLLGDDSDSWHDGSMSPALIDGVGSVSSSADWWLQSSSAGMGELLSSGAEDDLDAAGLLVPLDDCDMMLPAGCLSGATLWQC